MVEAPHALMTESPDGILTVTLNRPEKLNAISRQVTQILWQAVEALATRDDLRVLVITATGRYFTAGFDLTEPTSATSAAASDHDAWQYRRNYREHHKLYDEMEAIEKPIVLAAQATILGAGVEMAVSCDFRFCTPETEWGTPEINIGVIAGSGGSSRLQRLIGPAWAKWMAMAGMRIDAEKASQVGLVHGVFPSDRLMDETYAFCRKLIALPPNALGAAKLAVDLAADIADRNAQRNIDRLVNTTLVHSDEHRRRIERFKKR